jgi:hypothetical protein
MSWKHVFNTYKKFLPGTDFYTIKTFVLETGYQFFTFNEKIYYVNGSVIKGFTIEDLY